MHGLQKPAWAVLLPKTLSHDKHFSAMNDVQVLLKCLIGLNQPGFPGFRGEPPGSEQRVPP
jgi:hypothetical protein